MMMPFDYASLLQQERQRNKKLEQQVSELTAALEKLREDQMQLQMKMQMEAALHAKERQQWHEERQRRPVSLPSSPHRPSRVRPMSLKVLKLRKAGKCSNRLSVGRNVLNLPGVIRHHVQQLQQERQLYASVIENQKASVATEQTTRAFQERLHISESNVDSGNQSPATVPGQPAAPTVCEDEHKRMLMQQRLKSYLHTQTCRPPDDVQPIYGTSNPWHCGQLHCATMRKVLVHMDGCTGGMDCAVPLCCSTREVIEHWQSCGNDECPICRPAKESLLVHSEALAKTLEALNEGMDVAGAVNEPTPGTSLTMGGFGLSAVANNPARRVAFARPTRTFRRPVSSEAESDVGS